MRKPLTPRVTQLELFQPPRQSPELPREVKQRMVKLLARLLREYTGKSFAVRSGKEAGNE
jgi:hypothetical protein